ncbi:hypothetical protein Pelo_18232 [Pelomyxa schiedti]|nr:hypothetical protein Pelo_18232 [Pelomyxa schiedti]
MVVRCQKINPDFYLLFFLLLSQGSSQIILKTTTSDESCPGRRVTKVVGTRNNTRQIKLSTTPKGQQSKAWSRRSLLPNTLPDFRNKQEDNTSVWLLLTLLTLSLNSMVKKTTIGTTTITIYISNVY